MHRLVLCLTESCHLSALLSLPSVCSVYAVWTNCPLTVFIVFLLYCVSLWRFLYVTHTQYFHTHICRYVRALSPNINWGFVIISSCLLLIRSCLKLLSGNGNRDGLKTVNWSTTTVTPTHRHAERERDGDRDRKTEKQMRENSSTVSFRGMLVSPYQLPLIKTPHTFHDNMILKEM